MRPGPPLLGIALCFLCFARADGSPVSKEARECFEWFQTLGYPDVEKASWAEVWTGAYAGSVPPKALTLHGFITKSDGEKFTALTDELIPLSLTKSKPDTAAHHRVGYEKQPFHSYAAGVLEDLRHPPRENGWRHFGERLGFKARVFFLAYACWVKGDAALAQQLFDEAKKLPSSQNTNSGGKDQPMRLALKIELGHSAMWQAVLLFGDIDSWRSRGAPDVKLMPRRELLGVFRDFVRHYPQSPHMGRAKETVRILEQMVQEDEQHPALSDEALEKLPVEDQAKELIFRLRDQNGHQFSQPGACDIFDFYRPGGDTAAHRLVKIGYPAAPQLIEALGDERFSRSVGCHRNFYFSHHVLTIGDCAQQILNRIAARSFYTRRSTSSYMSRDNEIAAARKDAEDWWQEFQAKGEKETLIEGISSGQQDPTPSILRLMDKYPDALEGAVVAGAANASKEWFIQSYINAAGTLKTASAADWLRTQMKEAKTLRTRIAAARQLSNHGDSSALAAIISEWQRFTTDSNSSPGGDGLDALVDFLIASGDAGAMNALSKDWDRRGINERFEVVKNLGERLETDKLETMRWGLASKPPDAAAMDVAESLLAHALEDTSVRTGTSGSYGDYQYSNPRICDFALWSMHRLFPDRYAFSPVAEIEQRDNERISAANAWRRNHHQPELPMPATTSKTESQPR